MEDNLKIHMEEIHLEEIHLKDHHSIHMSYHLDGQHLTHVCSYHHGIHYLLHNLYQNQQPSSI